MNRILGCGGVGSTSNGPGGVRDNGSRAPPPLGCKVGSSSKRMMRIPYNTPRIIPDPNSCPPPCAPKLPPPVLGRFGNYHHSSSVGGGVKKGLKSQQAKIGSNNTRKSYDTLVREKRVDMVRLKYPEAPPPYRGPHNVMWDPHVRRGPTILHFWELEKKRSCQDHHHHPNEIKKKYGKTTRKNNNKQDPSAATATVGHGGGIIYPDIQQRVKQEFVDYSPYLEEQDEVAVPLKVAETQTDETNCNEWEVPDTTDIALLEKADKCDKGFRNNFDIGRDMQTQVDAFKLATEMWLSKNPVQRTIVRASKAIAVETLTQSIVEQMETEELAVIRAQCTELEHWLSNEGYKLSREQREWNKRLAKIQLNDKVLEGWEKMDMEVQRRVGAGLKAQCVMRDTFAQGFKKLERERMLGIPAKAEGFLKKVDETVATIVLRNEEEGVKKMVDDIIGEVVTKRKEVLN